MGGAQPRADYRVVDRRIGLLGGTVLLVGTVIGMSVFLLPGALIGEAGPSIALALVAAALPATFSILMLLQLGGALPVAGGIYVYLSRLVSPAWGFIGLWMVMPAIWFALLFTAIGFAEFSNVLLPVDLPQPVLVVLVLVAFMLLNLRGVTLVTTVQLGMVAAILLGGATFVIPGLFEVELANFQPLFPEGAEPFITAVVAMFIPFQGYSMIVELGEELEDPVRNIPRVLVLGMGIAFLLSLLLIAVFAGLDRYDVLAGYETGGVARAATDYISPAVGVVVAVAAILGAFTTLNALMTSYSRTLMRAGRDEVFSRRLARIGERTQIPHNAVMALSVPPLLLAPFELPLVTVSIFLAMAMLFSTFVTAFALWNLPRRFPEAYERSIYRLPMPVLRITSIGAATTAGLVWLAMASQATIVVVTIVGFVLAGYLYYRYLCYRFAKSGFDLKARLAMLDDHESREAAPATPSSIPDADARST
jgi:basic amino acid/polyamine antiporter, APA family